MKMRLDLSMHRSLMQSFCSISLLLWLGVSGILPGLKFYWLVEPYVLLRSGICIFLVSTMPCLWSSVMAWKKYFKCGIRSWDCWQWVQNSHKIIRQGIRYPCCDSNWTLTEHTSRVSLLHLHALLICVVPHLYKKGTIISVRFQGRRCNQFCHISSKYSEILNSLRKWWLNFG